MSELNILRLIDEAYLQPAAYIEKEGRKPHPKDDTAVAASLILTAIADRLPTLLSTPRSEEEYAAFSIAQREVALLVEGCTPSYLSEFLYLGEM